MGSSDDRLPYQNSPAKKGRAYQSPLRTNARLFLCALFAFFFVFYVLGLGSKPHLKEPLFVDHTLINDEAMKPPLLLPIKTADDKPATAAKTPPKEATKEATNTRDIADPTDATTTTTSSSTTAFGSKSRKNWHANLQRQSIPLVPPIAVGAKTVRQQTLSDLQKHNAEEAANMLKPFVKVFTQQALKNVNARIEESVKRMSESNEMFAVNAGVFEDDVEYAGHSQTQTFSPNAFPQTSSTTATQLEKRYKETGRYRRGRRVNWETGLSGLGVSNDWSHGERGSSVGYVKFNEEMLDEQKLAQQDLEKAVKLKKETSKQADPENETEKEEEEEEEKKKIARPKVLLFTMDSLPGYIAASKNGGPSGELRITSTLIRTLSAPPYSFEIMQATSDVEMLELSESVEFAFFIFDRFTYAQKGWIVRPFLMNRITDVFIMDFFGRNEISHRYQGMESFDFPPSRILTAFPTPSDDYGNFLGYYINQEELPQRTQTQDNDFQGIIWGKSPLYYSSKASIITLVASLTTQLHSSLDTYPGLEGKLTFHPEKLDKKGYEELLANCRFMIGLGDPLNGPSAVDAISRGLLYINPIYSKAEGGGDRMSKYKGYRSQHDWLASRYPEHVCSVDMTGSSRATEDNVQKCVEKALYVKLESFVPEELTKAKYEERVIQLFGRFVVWRQ